MKNIILSEKQAKYIGGLTKITLIISTIVVFGSCSKINESTQMDIAVSSPASAFNIPIISSTATGSTIAGINLNLNLDSLIKAQAPRFSPTNITSIKLTSFRVALTDSVEAENNFGNIENLTVTLQAAGQTSNTVAALSLPDNIVGGVDIAIAATDNDLRPYFSGTQLRYVITGKLRRATTKILKAKVTSSYRLKLNL